MFWFQCTEVAILIALFIVKLKLHVDCVLVSVYWGGHTNCPVHCQTQATCWLCSCFSVLRWLYSLLCSLSNSSSTSTVSWFLFSSQPFLVSLHSLPCWPHFMWIICMPMYTLEVLCLNTGLNNCTFDHINAIFYFFLLTDLILVLFYFPYFFLYMYDTTFLFSCHFLFIIF